HERIATFGCFEDEGNFGGRRADSRRQFFPTLAQRERYGSVRRDAKGQPARRGNRNSKSTKLLLAEKLAEGGEWGAGTVAKRVCVKGLVCARKIAGVVFLPRALEHWLKCSGHEPASADSKDRELRIAKIFVPRVVAEEHEAIGSDQQLAINFFA